MRHAILGLFSILAWANAAQASPAESEVQIWAASSLQKVRPDQEVQSRNLVWSADDRTVRIAGARNEHVPFQIVLSVPPPPNRYVPAASGFMVEASDLVGEASRIPRSNIKIYLEHAILVYGKSSPVGDTGFWSDALAPLTDPFSMAAAFRSAVRNRPLWIDIEVPEGIEAGSYRGTVSVSQNASKLGDVNIALTVYDFSLPRETHLITYMGISERWLASLHGLRASSPESRKLLRTYYEFLYRNRMEPWFNQLLQPLVEAKENGEVEVRFDDELYRYFLEELKTKRVILEAAPSELAGDGEREGLSEGAERRVSAYLSATAAYFRQHGWLDRLVFNSPIDEPNTREHYENTRKWASLVHEAAPGVPFLVTEAPVPDREEWGTLSGFANNFSVHGNQLNRPVVKDAIRAEQERGGEISWYISCDQVYPQPNYFIDAPSMDPVMVPWITWRYGMNGILYWALNFWAQTPNPWDDPVTYLSGFLCSDGWVLNGEGSLLYPGNHVRRLTGQRNVDGPVSSIRFELLREGIEDYEYLWLLKTLGEAEFANRAASDLVVDVSAFSRNPEELFRTREKLARRIAELSRR